MSYSKLPGKAIWPISFQWKPPSSLPTGRQVSSEECDAYRSNPVRIITGNSRRWAIRIYSFGYSGRIQGQTYEEQNHAIIEFSVS